MRERKISIKITKDPTAQKKADEALMADFGMCWYEITGIIIGYLCGVKMGIIVVFATLAAREFWRRYKRRREEKNERSNECGVCGVDSGDGRDELQSK